MTASAAIDVSRRSRDAEGVGGGPMSAPQATSTDGGRDGR